jgi:hypothetical protein
LFLTIAVGTARAFERMRCRLLKRRSSAAAQTDALRARAAAVAYSRRATS